MAPEFYDEKFLKHNLLIPRAQAFLQIHTPEDEEQVKQAQRRLKYDELFLMQLGLAAKRAQAHNTARREDAPTIPKNLRTKIPAQDKIQKGRAASEDAGHHRCPQGYVCNHPYEGLM